MRVVVIVAALCGVAHADGTEAERAFERGQGLLKAGKLDEACAAFAESLHLDFQYGTLYNLAGCDEKRGHLYAAWQAYARLGNEDTNTGRRVHSKELATQLEPRVPKLVVDIAPPKPAGLAVTIDGAPITDFGAPRPIEVGPHEIVATAPSFQRWHKTITAGDGATVNVQPTLAAASAGPPPPVEPTAAPGVDRRLVRDFPIAGPAITIAGGASLVFGIAFGFHAKSLYDSSKAGAMMGRTESLTDNRNAVRDGNIATWFAVAGIVAAPVGALMWHRGTWIVTPRPDGHGGSVSFSGRF